MSTENASAELVAQSSPQTTNWLLGWGPIEFNVDPNNAEKIQNAQDAIRWYVRGYLEELNDRPNKERPYNFQRFERFDFQRVSESPLMFIVNVVLVPPHREDEHSEGNDRPSRAGGPPLGGSHLIPPEPPKPSGTIGG